MDTKKLGLLGIIIAVLMIAGTVGYVYMGEDGDSPFAPDDADDAVGSSMEEDEYSDTQSENSETIDILEQDVNDDSTVTYEVPDVGTFTLDPTKEGIVIIKDADDSIGKTVTLDGDSISFDSNDYYAAVHTAGTFTVNGIPDDEASYKPFTGQLTLVANGINGGDGEVFFVDLEEITGGETVGGETVGGETVGEEITGEEPTAENPAEEPASTPSDDIRSVTVRIVDESGNGVPDVNVKIGTSIYKKTNSNGYTSSAEISTLNSYWINAYGNDDYETKSILLTKGTSDTTKTIEVEKLAGIPSGWVEFKVKAVSTVDYRYDGSDAILENVGMYFKTDGAYIYDVDRGAKVSYVSFMTDEQGYSPDNRFYVPETGQAVEIDASNHIIAYGIDRTLDASTDKNRCIWAINYCPKPVTLQFKSEFKSGTTSSGSDYEYWYVSYYDKQVGYNNYNIFHRASMMLGALFNGEDGDAHLEYSTDGSNWHTMTAMKDPYTTYGEVTIDVPSSGTSNLYIRTNYDSADDRYNDERLWTIGKTSTGYVDIDYKGLQ